MRNNARELQLIRLCIMLDDIELGERRETIMNLIHSARRASRMRQNNTTEALCTSARWELRRVLINQRLTGADLDAVALIELAMTILSPSHEETHAGIQTRLNEGIRGGAIRCL